MLSAKQIHLDKADWLEFAPVIWTPETGDERLSALVAYMTGDGAVTFRRGSKTGSLQSALYSNIEADVQTMLADCVSLGMAKGVNVKEKKTKPGYESGYQIQFCNADTQEFVSSGTPNGKKAEQEFDVPEWVKSGTPEIKRAYIAALFGAEGTTPTIDKSSKGRICRSPTLNMCKKAGYTADIYFESLANLINDLGVECSTSVTVGKDGYLTYWLNISKTPGNLIAFFEKIGFAYAHNKALLAWQWVKYLKAYEFAANQRAAICRAMLPDETYVELASKLGLTRGAAHRLRGDVLAGKTTTAGHNFPRFDEWMKERWVPELGLLRIKVTAKSDRPEKVMTWNLRVSSHDHSYTLASGVNNFNSFETMSGRVYYPFDRKEHCHADIKFNPGRPIWVGVDFNIDPMSAAIVQPQTNGEIWIVDEIFLHNSNTEELCEEIERRYWRYMNSITIYPDPAGAHRQHARGESDLEIFRLKGFKKIKFRRKHPAIADRVNSVNRMLKDAAGTTRLRVNPGCTNVVESLEQTLYKPGSRDVDKTASMEHITDALGYAVEIEFPIKKIVIAGHSI